MTTFNSLRLARSFASALALTTLAGSLEAGDWYVNAVTGNDQTNSGTSVNSPWRTITYALAHVSWGQSQRIHIAPGTYDDALGEVFPFTPGPGIQLEGAGSSVTHIATAGPFAVQYSHTSSSPYPGLGNDTQLFNCSVSASQQPILISSTWGPVAPWLFDVDVSGGSLAGITIYGLPPGTLAPLLFNVNSHDNGTGLSLTRGQVDSRTCSFSNNSNYGITIDLWGTSTGAHHVRLDMTRGRLLGNGSIGLSARTNTSNDVRFEVDATDCLIAGNSGHGVSAWQSQAWQNCTLTIERATIANNAMGVVTSGPGLAPATTLNSCIVYGNGDDLLYPVDPLVSFSDIGDGDFVGQNGNISADPSFVNAAGSDYRLRFASPCIEGGDPVSASGWFDLNFLPRPIDGDLDASEAPDIGAHEFAPLFLTQTPELGGLLQFEVWGETGAQSLIYFTRKPLLFTPMQTQFGELDLNPQFMGVFKVTTASAYPPTIVQRSIPNVPALYGKTFSFQALTNSSIAPAGAAYTNAYQFTLIP